MKKLYASLITIFFLIFNTVNLNADSLYFVDFKKVLNESIAGADAQKRIKDKYSNDTKKINNIEKKLKKEELEIIKQKKLITNEEYQKKVSELRKKVADLQKEKQKSFKDLTNLRNDSKKKLLQLLNPLMKDYMEKNKIRVILDKKSILLADSNFDLTLKIMDLLNKKVKSLK
tara:strand:+ start:6297 stop:6815 length:519 start_codon:yes stop_codon:yes gene_type:complete